MGSSLRHTVWTSSSSNLCHLHTLVLFSCTSSLCNLPSFPLFFSSPFFPCLNPSAANLLRTGLKSLCQAQAVSLTAEKILLKFVLKFVLKAFSSFSLLLNVVISNHIHQSPGVSASVFTSSRYLYKDLLELNQQVTDKY